MAAVAGAAVVGGGDGGGPEGGGQRCRGGRRRRGRRSAATSAAGGSGGTRGERVRVGSGCGAAGGCGAGQGSACVRGPRRVARGQPWGFEGCQGCPGALSAVGRPAEGITWPLVRPPGDPAWIRHGAVARPRLVCPLEWSDPLVAPVSVGTRPVSDVPERLLGHAPRHYGYVTCSNGRDPRAELTRGLPHPRGTIFHPWVAVETKI